MRPIQFFLLKANAYQKDSHDIKQQLTTEPGKSGSPILVKRENKIIAIGIHKGGLPNSDYNIGRAITDDLLFNLVKWEKEMQRS
jgi:V8-like Glu-specific endopeptidase